ncbi:hypothetical protein PRZ48_002155 [Zasmidium cellare]|uniref:NAD(P)-binding protein n=1 Tax=Zasmidium cellare TaxID=395010 RepID=A0ABR0F3Z6_ZASCE|nr:hypothetical protein PRZ48_002155 [Zasmidium cellare]
MASILPDTARLVLTVLGGLGATYYSLKTLSYLHLHFIRRNTLDRYKTDSDKGSAWALVTGATDGIGRAFAVELASRGFNVFIHGRNEQKLESLKKRLQEQHPKVQFRTLIMDAGKEINDSAAFEKAANELSQVNLKVLVNNVGGASGLLSFMPLHERPSDQIRTIMDINARFPIEITRALLPQLRANNPALILNVGSTSSEFGIPYLSVYASCKAANRAWSRSIASEMRAEGVDIEVLCLWISAVATDYVPKATSLFVPSAQQLARYGLQKIGCGKSTVFAYWAHEIQANMFWILPEWIQTQAIVDIGKQEKLDDEARNRKTS